MESYDYIIAGAGCAGLSLAYQMNKTVLKDKKILIIDKKPKDVNDRTWCFWTEQPTAFDHIVCKRWDKVQFYGENFGETLKIAPYQYQMIRGIDFYTHIQTELAANSNITFLYGNIEKVYNEGDKAKIQVNKQIFEANYLFNSAYFFEEQIARKGYHYIYQHFKGWLLETPMPFFEEEVATFMDFRIAQHDEVRFFYILPLSPYKALVEFTIFSEDLLAQEAYVAEIKQYLQNVLHLTDYKILEEEGGALPMFDEPCNPFPKPHVVNIGILGGQTKASTGYTFLRIQEQTKAIIEMLLKEGHPFYKSYEPKRFKFYDSLLLNIMKQKKYATKAIFTQLFKKHPIQRIFKFLDEKTTLLEDFKIMKSVSAMPFLKAIIHILTHRK